MSKSCLVGQCPPKQLAKGQSPCGIPRVKIEDKMMEKSKRQQTEKITFRVLPEVKKQLEIDAEKVGLSVSGLVKFRTCGDAAALMPTKQKRLPSDMGMLRQILGKLGRIGGNVNQIAKRLNSTDDFRIEKREVDVLVYRVRQIRSDLLAALGITRS